MINNNVNNYSYSILCFQRALQLVHYVIFNVHSCYSAKSVLGFFVVVCFCNSLFMERKKSEEQRRAEAVTFTQQGHVQLLGFHSESKDV